MPLCIVAILIFSSGFWSTTFQIRYQLYYRKLAIAPQSIFVHLHIMTKNKELSKFLEAQNIMYLTALAEIKNGKKESHWMWFIFPQIKGLGRSETARHYAINDLEEAAAYLEHPVLGKHLIEISNELLKHEGRTASEIFSYPDDLKLRSSMTLFALVNSSNPIFEEVLLAYFDGKKDEATVKILRSIQQ